ncbi:RtcB family protein [Chloroflexus sp.]|uniref:RtcB family protein n=1 Tax=Chloroflexus sp. TaxID=1904827 RepID=UPI002ACE1CFF|nr:RtcB family protein [Chloroflexus sp.]
MKAAQLLADYADHPAFRQICRTASQMLRDGMEPAAVRQEVAARYGAPPEALKLREKPQPLKIIGEHLVEPGAIEQIRTALRLPPAIRGALMPDAHQGYALPVGGVIAYDRAVAPYQVGVDIGCRMHLSILAGMTPVDAQRERQHLLDTITKVTVFGIGSPKKPVATHPILSDPRWRATKLLRELHELAKLQIGTSGGGNHFAEIVVGEWLDTGKPFIGLLTHSGSRGVGAKIANYYAELADRETAAIAKGIPRTYGWLSTESEAGQEYLLSMRLAGDFARANHEVIHERFAKALGVPVERVIENHHNFAWEERNGLVIHRKGATPAEAGVLGIIPGSMATASYIVEGLGDKATLASAAHGAGRRFSRSEARRTITPVMAAAVVREAGVLVHGLAVDESPLAYKDIEAVMEVQVAAGLIRPVARMRPLVVVMSGAPGED